MESWNYAGKFLEQFPRRLMGCIADEFCKAVRDGYKTPEAVITAIALKRERVGYQSQPLEALMAEGVLTSEGAVEFAEFIIEREALPWEEKQRLKEASRLEKGGEYAKLHMATQPPTDKQLSYLRFLGCSEIPESKLEASELIDRYLKKKSAA